MAMIIHGREIIVLRLHPEQLLGNALRLNLLADEKKVVNEVTTELIFRIPTPEKRFIKHVIHFVFVAHIGTYDGCTSELQKRYHIFKAKSNLSDDVKQSLIEYFRTQKISTRLLVRRYPRHLHSVT